MRALSLFLEFHSIGIARVERIVAQIPMQSRKHHGKRDILRANCARGEEQQQNASCARHAR